ncbi:MAG: transposase, partial [Endozoicomonas sp.]
MSDSLKNIAPSARLTRLQKVALTTLIMGIVVTETLNWAAFERRSLGKFKPTRLCWIFRSAKIAWHHMLQASVRNILSHYAITEGTLAIDDTARQRSKRTLRIEGTHKIRDKPTGGYINGQELVFMVLVTDIATFPVGFRFYVPDPQLSAWRKHNKALKKQKVAKKLRPQRPAPDHARFPTLQALALEMIREFADLFPEVVVKGVLADALYGTGKFMNEATILTGQTQVVSQLRSNQKVSAKGQSEVTLSDYFTRQKGVETQLIIRGGKTVRVTMLAARLTVKAHKKRRFVVALKYE